MHSKKICLVTEELSHYGKSGGIGAAFDELASLLIRYGNHVDIIYCPNSTIEDRSAVENYLNRGIKLSFLRADKYVWEPISAEKKSYSVCRTLMDNDNYYDFIHFHDYKGLAFFTLEAKRQRMAFDRSTVVVQIHGPTRWALQKNMGIFSHVDQIKIDYMEKKSIEWADHIVSPSNYMVGWLRENDYCLPAIKKISVIKNIFGMGPRRETGSENRRKNQRRSIPDEIVFFGRHEDRKGFVLFCDALDLIAADLSGQRVTVTFLGPRGVINGDDSGLYLAKRGKKWNFTINVITGFDRSQANHYISSISSAVVVVSSEENSPYTVIETIRLGTPVLILDRGGAIELVDKNYAKEATFSQSRQSLADRLLCVVKKGIAPPRLSESVEQIEASWIQFHETKRAGRQFKVTNASAIKPTVTVGITHHERPRKLFDSVISIAQQTVRPNEVFVSDDGSSSEHAVAGLAAVEKLLSGIGGSVIRGENRYLGAARNRIIEESGSDYVIFLDDDDYALPELVETLISAAIYTQADVVIAVNVYMDEKMRDHALARPKAFDQRVAYVPLGGPLNAALSENCLGAATSIIRREKIREIGGYSEMFGVGFEDHELYLKILESGGSIEVCPMPLYLYEVGTSSMLSESSVVKSTRRVTDSICKTSLVEKWTDALQLLAGQKAHELQQNRLDWAYSQNAGSEYALPVFRKQVSGSDALQLTADYADFIGAGSVAAGIRRWCNSETNSQKREDPQKTISIRRAATDVELTNQVVSSDLNDILVDVGLSRYESALKRIITTTKKTGYVDRRQMDIVARIANASDRVVGTYSEALFEAIEPLAIDKKQLPSALAAVFSLAVRESNNELIQKIFNIALSIDVINYKSNNRIDDDDVADIDLLGQFLEKANREISGEFELVVLLAMRYNNILGLQLSVTRLYKLLNHKV